jgi:hypothetical protein
MRLVKVLAATAAVFALAAGSAMAATEVSGYVGASYSNVDTDAADVDVWGISGAYAAPLGENLGLQLDAGWATVDDDGAGDDDDALNGTVHLFSRNESMLIGGAVGVVDSDDSTTWGAAVEADWYFENSTAGGRILYATNDDADVDFWGIDAHYRYFATDNVRIEGNVGYGQADSDGGFEADVWSVGAEVEYQFDAAPVSLYGGVSFANIDSDLGGDTDATALTLGVRYNFGGSLKNRDRTGASLAPLATVGGTGVGGLF